MGSGLVQTHGVKHTNTWGHTQHTWVKHMGSGLAHKTQGSTKHKNTHKEHKGQVLHYHISISAIAHGAHDSSPLG